MFRVNRPSIAGICQMSLKGEYFPDNVDEEARRRFERALAAGSSVLIDDYLPDIADHKYLATLEELVSISLEYSWQHWTAEPPGPAPQPLEYFLSRFPVLAESGIQKRLRELEQSVRRETRRTATHTTSCTVSESSGSPVSRSLPASGQGESSTDPAAHPRQFRFQDQFRSLMPHYEILEKISGRAETTYRGYDWSRHREVKLSHIASPRGDVVKSLKTLCAPFIKPMDDSVVFPDGSSVLVMEQIQGRGLQQRMMENGGTIAEATALKWMKQICEGMTYVAARKIVHRNLKPANI